MSAMSRDFLGNPVTGAGEATQRVLDEFLEGFLAYETRAEAIIQGAADAPECPLAHTYAGFLCMFLEAPGAARGAARYLRRADALAGGATRREQLNLAILKAWAGDDIAGALKACDACTDEFPRDLAVVKLQQYFEFNRGNAPEMLRIALKSVAAAPEVAYVHGMLAFGYEQCHLLEAAEDAAQRALKLKRKEPWAQHALAHVYLTRGQIDAGARFMESVQDTWTGLNSFMVTHLWWHLALFYLSQGRHAEALAAYDDHCWGVFKEYSQDQVGAISLLARFEMADIDVGARWQDLGKYLKARTADTVQPFLTLQYLYGLARAGLREGAVLLDVVRGFAAKAPPFSRAVWQEVALPMAEGLYAHATGDYDLAWRRLEGALPRLQEVGGSHAQRDLFEQIFLDTALKSGRLVDAQQRLELRRHADPDGVPVNRALADVYGRLRLPALAEQARSRAAHTEARHRGHAHAS
jgi:predicted Zn-dependent protease